LNNFDFDQQVEDVAYFKNTQRMSHLNGREITKAKEWLYNESMRRYGKYCCWHCFKSRKQLEDLWMAKRTLEGKPTRRDKPYLIIQEVNGRGLHTVNPKTHEVNLYGNVGLTCFSCNAKFCKHTGDIKANDNPTYQARKSQNIRPKFKNFLQNTLAKAEHICYKAMINKWSSDSFFQCSQDLLEAAFQQEYDIVWEFYDLDEECGYEFCNGKHVILKNQRPIKPKSDYEAFLDERDDSRES